MVGFWFLIFSFPFLMSCKKTLPSSYKKYLFSDFFLKNLKRIGKDKNKLNFFIYQIIYLANRWSYFYCVSEGFMLLGHLILVLMIL